MQFSLRTAFVVTLASAATLAWLFARRINPLFDPPTPVFAVGPPLIGAAFGAMLAAVLRRERSTATFAIVGAVLGALLVCYFATRLSPAPVDQLPVPRTPRTTTNANVR